MIWEIGQDTPLSESSSLLGAIGEAVGALTKSKKKIKEDL